MASIQAYSCMGLRLLKDASFTTCINERSHGYAARLREGHKQYMYDTIASRSTISSCKALFGLGAFEKKISALERKLARIERKRPECTPTTAMFWKELAQEVREAVNDEPSFANLQEKMLSSKERWHNTTVQERERLNIVRCEHIEANTREQAAARMELIDEIQKKKYQEEHKFDEHGFPNLVAAATKFSDADLQELSHTVTSRREGHQGVPSVYAGAPREPALHVANELARMEATMLPQTVPGAMSPSGLLVSQRTERSLVVARSSPPKRMTRYMPSASPNRARGSHMSCSVARSPGWWARVLQAMAELQTWGLGLAECLSMHSLCSSCPAPSCHSGQMQMSGCTTTTFSPRQAVHCARASQARALPCTVPRGPGENN